jgi:MFS family permease
MASVRENQAQEDAVSSPQVRNAVFGGILLLQYFLTADYAVFPAAFMRVKEDLDMDDFEMGLAGTLAYTGLCVSSLISGSLLANYHPRKVIIPSLVLSSLGTAASALAQNKHRLFVVRFFVGLAHGPCYTLFPVWADTYAPIGYETQWMTAVQVLASVANVLSYAIVAGLAYGLGLSWRWSFGYLSICTMLCVPAGMFVPEDLWCKRSLGSARSQGFSTLFPYKVFWILCLVSCLGYYTVSGAQYFAVRILVHMGVPERNAPSYFLAAAVTGPVLGMLAGGPLFDKFGGYRHRANAFRICGILLSLSFIVAWWVIYPSTPLELTVAVALAMGTFAAAMPALMGLTLDTVPEALRTHASGCMSFLTDAIGFQLAPMVSGHVMATRGVMTGWRSCWTMTMTSPFILLIAVMIERLGSGGPNECDEEWCKKPGDRTGNEESRERERLLPERAPTRSGNGGGV